MTLTQFLLARIAEDEAWARDVAGSYYSEPFDNGDLARPERLLAECQSKRKILRRTRESNGYWGQDIERAMLIPYLDHPDCRHEWWQ